MNPSVPTTRWWNRRSQTRLLACALVAASSLGAGELLVERIARPSAPHPASQHAGSTPAPAAAGVPRAAAPADTARVRQQVLPWSLGLGALGAWLTWWLPGRVRSGNGPGPSTSESTARHRSRRVPTRRREGVRQIESAMARLQADLLTPPAAGRTRSGTPADPVEPLPFLQDRAHQEALIERLSLDMGDGNTEFCVLHLGIGGFTALAERCGEAAAADVLGQVAQRLRRIARQGDLLFRLDAGAHLLLLPCPPGEGQALARVVAIRALAELKRPYSHRTLKHLHLDCRIGSALWPNGGITLWDAMRQAAEAQRAARHGADGAFRQHIDPALPPQATPAA